MERLVTSESQKWFYLRLIDRLERLSLVNALKRVFAPDSPIMLFSRFNDRFERLMSLINEVEREAIPLFIKPYL